MIGSNLSKQAQLEVLIKNMFHSSAPLVNRDKLAAVDDFLGNTANLNAVNVTHPLAGSNIPEHMRGISILDLLHKAINQVSEKPLSKAMVAINWHYSLVYDLKKIIIYLNSAVAQKKENIVDELLNVPLVLDGISKEIDEGHFSNVLNFAVEHGNVAIFKKMMNLACIKNHIEGAHSTSGMEYLITAIKAGQEDIVDLLISLDCVKYRITYRDSDAFRRAYFALAPNEPHRKRIHDKIEKLTHEVEAAEQKAQAIQAAHVAKAAKAASQIPVQPLVSTAKAPVTSAVASTSVKAPVNSAVATISKAPIDLFALDLNEVKEDFMNYFLKHGVYGLENKLRTMNEDELAHLRKAFRSRHFLGKTEELALALAKFKIADTDLDMYFDCCKLVYGYVDPLRQEAAMNLALEFNEGIEQKVQQSLLSFAGQMPKSSQPPLLMSQQATSATASTSSRKKPQEDDDNAAAAQVSNAVVRTSKRIKTTK